MQVSVMQVSVIELLEQLAIVIPTIIVGVQTITAAIRGIFNIENPNTVHWISWIVAVLAGVGFVAFNGLTFGLSIVWDYIVGGICGLIAGGAANGLYDWPAISKIFDAITALFTPKRRQ